MARSHSTSTTSWEPVFPKSRMAFLPVSNTTQVPQTIDHVLTTWVLLLGLSISWIFSVLSYPKWAFNPLPQKYVIKKACICRIPKFWRRRNSEKLISVYQILQLISEIIVFLFGVTVETSWLQSGKTFDTSESHLRIICLASLMI